PHFDYKGSMCGMAAFKAHCVVGFWKASLLKDFTNILEVGERTSMGNLGRMTSIDDLPSDEVLIPLIQEAWRLNNENIKVPASKKAAKEVDDSVSDDFTALLNKAPQAQFNFEKMSPSQKREYTYWFKEAKADTTREKRMATAIEWLTEGKNRNWKYEKK
ncbi:MAG: YdeI/OmpD-associated family protein, partial [Saprospiraceae bacterium]